MGESRVFVRQATGLVRSVSFLDSIAINISYMSIGAALALIGFTMLALPTVSGVNLVYGSAIAALFAVPQMIVYTIMQRHISRTGGDYVWVSRSLGGFAGSTLTFMGITLETMPYLALIALSAVFAIGSVGANLGYSGMVQLAIPGATPVYQFLIGSLIVALLVFLNIFRPNSGFRIISIFWAIGIISIVVSIASLLFAGREGVVNYVGSLDIANTTFNSIANSYQGSTSFNLGNTLLILPFFALFSYPWFNAAPSVGSELKGGKTIRWSTPVSLLVAFILLTVPFAVMYYVGGFAFTNSALSNSNLVNNYSFNFWTLAMGVSGSYLVKLIIGLGWILFTVAVLAFGIITISRYLLAQAFDRFLPERLAYVSPKYGSPVVAHLLDLVITVISDRARVVSLRDDIFTIRGGGGRDDLFRVCRACSRGLRFQAVAQWPRKNDSLYSRSAADPGFFLPDLRVLRVRIGLGRESSRLRIHCGDVSRRRCDLRNF